MLRKIIITVTVIGVTCIAYAGWRGFGGGHGHDYRDPIQLAAAVKAQEHAASASCVQLQGLTYLCSAASSGLTMGTYRVTVAADGSAYTTATP